MKKKVNKNFEDSKLLEDAAKVLRQENDSYETFGSYVASEMRSLQVDRLRRKLKRKIQQAILEVSTEEDEILHDKSHVVSTPTCQDSPALLFDSDVDQNIFNDSQQNTVIENERSSL